MQGARVQPLIRALDPTYCNWVFVYINKKIQHAATKTMLHAESLQSCLILCDPLDMAHQAPLSMRFSGKNTGVGCCASPPGNLPYPGIKPPSLTSPTLAGRFFTTSATWQLRPGTAKLKKQDKNIAGTKKKEHLSLTERIREGIEEKGEVMFEPRLKAYQMGIRQMYREHTIGRKKIMFKQGIGSICVLGRSVESSASGWLKEDKAVRGPHRENLVSHASVWPQKSSFTTGTWGQTACM